MTPRSVALILAVALSAPSLLAAPGVNDERLRNAEAVLREMAEAFDTGIPRSLLEKAECVVIIPSVRRAALGIGGQYGRGYMICRKNERTAWSAPAGLRVEGGSVGLQIGGSATDLVLLVMNQRGAERLMGSQFTVGADASVAAGPVGRQAQAATDATMMAEILAWSKSRGVFAGISLQGSTLRTDGGENEELYGRELSTKEVINGDLTIPDAAKGLMDALRAYGGSLDLE